MRSILIVFYFIIFFMISIPLFLVELIIGLFSIHARARVAQVIIAAVFKIALWLGGVHVTMAGRENVPRDRAVLFVFNHRSYTDIPICYSTVPVLSAFVSMQAMSRFPFVNVWMWFLRCLFIDRGNLRQEIKTISAAIDLIRQGYSVFIAPEGRRNPAGETDMIPFKEGSFKIAKKTGCPIVPVAINNADKIFERHMPWIRKTRVMIEYGRPVYIKDLNADSNVGAAVQAIIKQMLEKNQKVID